MSVIIRVMILLIILIGSFCSSTASSDKPSKLTRLHIPHIRRCRCPRSDVPRGKLRCPSPLIPTDNKGKWDLSTCLCRIGTEKNRPELQQFCRVQFATLL